jgi:hypothetical protein
VTYSFPSGFKTFDSSKAFSGGYGDFSSASSLKSGGGMFDPLSLGLGLGSSVISGLFGMGQQKTAASIAQAQLAAQNQAFLEGREQNKGALGGSMFNKLFDAGTGGDIAFEREKAGKKFLTGPYAERLMGLGSEASKRERMAAISPESKERAQFENRLAIQRSLAEKRAQTDAMFGPISSSYRV